MKWTKAQDFPRPSNNAAEIVIGKSRTTLTATLFAFAITLIFIAAFQAAASLTISPALWFAGAALVAFLSMPAHELLHAVVHPKIGMSEQTRFGAGRVIGVPALWVGYAGWVSRKRAIAILLSPVVCLGLLLPLGGLLVDKEVGNFLLVIAATNILLSRNDLLSAYHLMRLESQNVYESERGFYSDEA